MQRKVLVMILRAVQNAEQTAEFVIISNTEVPSITPEKCFLLSVVNVALAPRYRSAPVRTDQFTVGNVINKDNAINEHQLLVLIKIKIDYRT